MLIGGNSDGKVFPFLTYSFLLVLFIVPSVFFFITLLVHTCSYIFNEGLQKAQLNIPMGGIERTALYVKGFRFL